MRHFTVHFFSRFLGSVAMLLRGTFFYLHEVSSPDRDQIYSAITLEPRTLGPHAVQSWKRKSIQFVSVSICTPLCARGGNYKTLRKTPHERRIKKSYFVRTSQTINRRCTKREWATSEDPIEPLGIGEMCQISEKFAILSKSMFKNYVTLF